MVWRVQSLCEGPVVLNDIGFTFIKGGIRDLDLIGRENAEKSNDIKLALQKGWIKTLQKDPSTPSGGIDQAILDKLQESSIKATAAAVQAEKTAASQADMIGRLEESKAKLEENNSKLQAQIEVQQTKLEAQQAQMSELVDKSNQILSEVRAFVEKSPIDARVMAEALRNIKIERTDLHGMISTGDSATEIEAKQKILRMRDEKLKKNADNIGKAISKTAEDIDDTLEALDALGIN